MSELKYPFLSSISDDDLITIYGESAKCLRSRGLLASSKKELRRIISSKSYQNCDTPVEFSRGKVKKLLSHSILVDFLSEDWSYLFSNKHNYDKRKDYYVYYHSDPRMPNMRLRKGDVSVDFRGRPFYVGKGKGDRYKSKKRGRDHLSIIKNLTVNNGIDESRIFHIFRDGLTELEAIELEAKLITFFGCQSEISRNRAHFHGIKGGLLVNSDPSVRPECVSKMISIKGGQK
jgi:hypothetical protein